MISVESAVPARQPMRILLLLHELSRSGAPKVALDTFDELKATGCYDIRIWSLNGGPLDERARRIGALRVLAHDPLPLPFLPAGAAFRFNGRVQNLAAQAKWQPDLLYFNTLVGLNWMRYTRLPRAPWLLHVLESGSAIDFYTARFQAEFRTRPRRYIAPSDSVRADLAARGIREDKIAVSRPFMHDEPFRKYLQARQERPPNARFTVGGAGRISWCKGPELWLLAARHLANLLGEEAVRWRWIGVGESLDDAQFRATIARLKLEAVVECVPPTSEPLAEFAQLDAFAVASWQDSAPLVTLENMRLEVPVICFAGGGGAPELVGEPSLIVPHFSSEGMAQVLALLARDPQRRAALGQAARERVQSQFSAAAQMPAVEAAIAQAVAGP